MKKYQGSGDMGREEEFIFKIQPYITSWQKCFCFGVVSAIIAQACHETGFGASDKAQYNNYFGLKYKEGRVTCNSGKITSTSFEYKDGVRYPIVCDWYAFADMNTGVQGYFQFINTGGYKVAKSQTTPEGYLQALKDAGYATGPNYVEHCMALVNKYNLTQFDEGGGMKYKLHPIDPARKPDSPLALKAIWSPNNTFPRQTNKKPNQFTIIPHCIAGNPSAEAQAVAFCNPDRGASAHYVIDSKGVIIQNVPEDCRAWTTGGDLNVNGLTGAEIDHEAITFEIGNISREPLWAMSEEAITSVTFLMVDICKRNGIPCLIWKGNKFLAGTPEQNVAAHRWFATKSCPGPFLYDNMGAVCDTVNYYLALGKDVNPNSGYFVNGLDYSPVFDPEVYRQSRPDIVTSPYYGPSDADAWKHFLDFGMKEFIETDGLADKRTSNEFCPRAYYDRYSDLREAFGGDFFKYYSHYITNGKSEGRNAL